MKRVELIILAIVSIAMLNSCFRTIKSGDIKSNIGDDQICTFSKIKLGDTLVVRYFINQKYLITECYLEDTLLISHDIKVLDARYYTEYFYNDLTKAQNVSERYLNGVEMTTEVNDSKISVYKGINSNSLLLEDFDSNTAMRYVDWGIQKDIEFYKLHNNFLDTNYRFINQQFYNVLNPFYYIESPQITVNEFNEISIVRLYDKGLMTKKIDFAEGVECDYILNKQVKCDSLKFWW